MDTENENEPRAEVDISLIWHLHQSGYMHITFIPGRGYCGIERMVCDDWDLCYGLTWDYITGRYCYSGLLDAITGIHLWDGVGHPPGNWVTHKNGRLKEKNPSNGEF